ncbi:MAG: Gfo/Idh/MocA family protein [Alphaproteobacteria bacterium]|jgi:UDP-N-acetyl-2-amino-2-deoxyglucuronate dehydrogenase
MAKKIQLGFLGCGRISSKHFDALENLSQFIEIKAVCDINLDKAQKAASRFNCNFYTDLNTMLDSARLDLVTIATPNGLHPKHSIICAKRGVDVFSEKPMAVSDESAKNLIEELKASGINFFLVHQNRYNDPVKYIKKAMDDGRFGKIYMMTSNVFWQRPQEYYDHTEWHGTDEMDGGAYMTQASHYVDMLNWFAGAPVDHVFAELDTLGRNIKTEDTGSVIIRWKNQIIGNINVTVLTYPKNFEGSITIIGEKGTAKIGGVALNKLEHAEFQDMPDADDASSMNYETDSVYGYGHYHAYKKIIEYYNDGNSDDIIDLDDAYSSFSILNAIRESSKQKTVIYL